MKNQLIQLKAFLTKLFSVCFILASVNTHSLCQDAPETGFYLVFEDTQSEEIGQILAFIAEDQELLFEVVDELNDYLAIPAVVPIVFIDCGQANAYYDPEQVAIFICHEMIAKSFQVYANLGLTEDELSLAIGNNTFSIMLHEIGHALVDILELPITGREEDAVDQFSVVSLLEFDDLGHEALIDFAGFWGGLAAETETSLAELPFYDEHSLSSQRFYDILCLAYGSDPTNLAFLVEEGLLPEQRAVRCADEFDKILNAWEILLDPYVRE